MRSQIIDNNEINVITFVRFYLLYEYVHLPTHNRKKNKKNKKNKTKKNKTKKTTTNKNKTKQTTTTTNKKILIKYEITKGRRK